MVFRQDASRSSCNMFGKNLTDQMKGPTQCNLMGMEGKYQGDGGGRGGSWETRHQGINCYNIYLQNTEASQWLPGGNKEVFQS